MEVFQSHFQLSWCGVSPFHCNLPAISPHRHLVEGGPDLTALHRHEETSKLNFLQLALFQTSSETQPALTTVVSTLQDKNTSHARFSIFGIFPPAKVTQTLKT